MKARHIVVAVLAAAAVAGGGLGLAFGKPAPDGPLADGPAAVLARGDFRTVSWATTGTAAIVRDGDGHLLLRFSRSFRTQRAPELYVHMGSRRMTLQRAWGSQSYRLKGADARVLGATVQVFCEKCNKAWGEATLRPLQQRAQA